MIQVTVKNLSGVVTHLAQFNSQVDADAWILSQQALKSFGKNERWVDAEDLSAMGEDRNLAIATQHVGGPDDERTQFKFSAEYVIEQSDVTAKIDQDKKNEQALSLLKATDWFVLRLAETGKAIPPEVLAERLAARLAIVNL